MSTEKVDSGHRWYAATYDLLAGRGESKLLNSVRARIMGEAEGRQRILDGLRRSSAMRDDQRPDGHLCTWAAQFSEPSPFLGRIQSFSFMSPRRNM